jgi:hypothetical protein
MSSGVPKSNEALENALNNVTDASSLRETLLNTLAEQGQIFRTRDPFNNRLIRQPEQNVSLPANGYVFEKEIRWAESTGKRPVIIRANSQADLDALERQVTGQ